MKSERRFAFILLGFSIATATTLSIAQVARAQGLLQMIEERRAAMEQAQAKSAAAAGQPTESSAAKHAAAAGAGATLPPGDVSMVTLKTEVGPGGQQLVITPKGMSVPLPGAGVSGKAVQIYMGSNGGYWYTDKDHHRVDLTSQIQRLQAQASATGGRNFTPPQFAPNAQSHMQATQGATTGGAGVAAMAGAATSKGSTWDSVPYGAPVHYGAAAQPYYNQNGKQVYINDPSITNVNASALQDELAWYRQQQAAQGDNYQVWQQPVVNPFIMAGYGAEYAAAPYGAYAGAEAAHYGAVAGEDAARYGAAAGVGAAHYGAEEGQQAARYGAAEGATAAHYGAAEGTQAARFGAAEGASAAHYGADGARFGAADGHFGADGARFGGDAERMGGAGRFGGRRR